MELFSENPIFAYQHLEVLLHSWAHSTLHRAEPLWAILSEYFGPAQLIDVFVPLVGVFSHQLLVRLVSFMGVVNAIASLVKWCLPAYRPYWFAREFKHLSNVTVLPQHRLTCETSAGFPSAHTLSFTAFLGTISLFYIAVYQRRYKVPPLVLDRMNLPICLFVSTFMCLSRVYMGTQFIYQCLLSGLAANALIYVFMAHATFLGRLGRSILVMTVLCFGLLVPVLVYFAMLGMNMDPHWSVRMAFKWCADPSFLRHEASPVFVLARDFGYLMGIALSAPLYKRYEKRTTSFTKRLLFLLFVALLNYYARLGTPKQHGRFVFVAYEFTRNLIHSYTLLSVLSKIT